MKIIAFGEVMLRLMPPNYKKLIQVDTLEFLFTGTGVNVLSGLYQCGHEVYLITRLPQNIVGQSAASQVRKLGIHDDYVTYGSNHIGIYIYEQGIGNRTSTITYLNRLESSFNTSQMSDYDFSCLDGMSALHICGISLALSQQIREIVFKFAKEARKRNVKVIFDCNFRQSLWKESHEQIKLIYEKMLRLSDIVFAGYKDATLLLDKHTDLKLPYIKQLEDVMKQMCKDYHIEVIFGTMREKQYLSGYMVNENDMIISSKMELTILDRIGGGDGFAAGAIDGYFSHMSDRELIEYATTCGVLAHTTYGDSAILSKDEIVEYIKNGQSDIKR